MHRFLSAHLCMTQTLQAYGHVRGISSYSKSYCNQHFFDNVFIQIPKLLFFPRNYFFLPANSNSIERWQQRV